MLPSSFVKYAIIVAFLEGFAGLGIEIYALRVSAAYIGSSTAITGVILAMVLIAIAIGYWIGGKGCPDSYNKQDSLQQAGKLLALSALSHTAACIGQSTLLHLIGQMGVNPLIGAGIVGSVFGIGLAFGSASIPLITQYIGLTNNSQASALGQSTGFVVATTTIGSVLGSTITPIILLPYVGLMQSLLIFIGMLLVGCLVLTHLSKLYDDGSQNNDINGNYVLAISAALASMLYFIFGSQSFENTGYQTATTAWFIEGFDYAGSPARGMTDSPGHVVSSCWLVNEKKSCGWYGEQVVSMVNQLNAKNLLFFGGAGMAIPSEIGYRHPNKHLTVVDIDERLPYLVETHFLQQKLAPNIQFVGEDARGFTNRLKIANYDFLLIDVFHGYYVSSSVYTFESLQKIKGISKNIVANVIGAPNKDHDYTQTLLTTWVKVFGDNAYILLKKDEQAGAIQNFMLCNFACNGAMKITQTQFFKPGMVNTDNKPILDKYAYLNSI